MNGGPSHTAYFRAGWRLGMVLRVVLLALLYDFALYGFLHWIGWVR